MGLRELTGTFLVTGGTGSFGSMMVKHLLVNGAEEVRVFSRDEAKQHALRRELGDSRVQFYIGDVRDMQSVDDAVRGAEHIFHAAAMKQVPSCEFFPMQAVSTNIAGGENVIRAAVQHGVKSLVCLSTDKAVYPINAMGISKAMMEKVAQAYSRTHQDSGLTISITRYGNVMASRGSVIPVFIDQIVNGHPLTITDPKMTRFLMSLEESVELVRYAMSYAKPGDLFVKKAPACTVQDLALAIANLFDVRSPEIRIIGTRHGEKLYESLLSREELEKAEDQGEFYRVPLDARSLDYELYFEEGEGASPVQDYTSHNTERLSVEAVMDKLLALPYVRRALQAAGRGLEPVK